MVTMMRWGNDEPHSLKMRICIRPTAALTAFDEVLLSSSHLQTLVHERIKPLPEQSWAVSRIKSLQFGAWLLHLHHWIVQHDEQVGNFGGCDHLGTRCPFCTRLKGETQIQGVRKVRLIHTHIFCDTNLAKVTFVTLILVYFRNFPDKDTGFGTWKYLQLIIIIQAKVDKQ